MSDVPIDGLEIEFVGKDISDGIENTTNALENLRDTLVQLNKVLDKVDFDQFGGNIAKLAKSLAPLQGWKSQAAGVINSLKGFVESANELNNFEGFNKFSSQIQLLATSISPLQNMKSGLGATLKQLGEVPTIMETLENSSGSMNEFTENIKLLVAGLAPLETVSSKLGAVLNQLSRFPRVLEGVNETSGSMGTFTTQIKRLGEALQPLSAIESRLGAALGQLGRLTDIMLEVDSVSGSMATFGEHIKQLVEALVPLSTVKTTFGSVLSQLSRLPEVLKAVSESLATVNLSGISALVEAVKPLGEITSSKSGILTMLSRLGRVTEELSKVDLEAFAAKIREVTVALAPLAAEMEKVAKGFDKFPEKLQKIVEGGNAVTRSQTRMSMGFGHSILKLSALVYLVRRFVNYASNAVVKSNQFVENLHLFRLSMGDAAEEAYRYGEAVQEALGIDLSEWMRYQAVFQNMAKGFGIASDKAAIMSKNLTQLGYDLASVFNVSFEESMRKLESAIAGQPRPMREWGFDISETTLKMVALNHGIEKNVETMTQMEKAQLRFVQIMETSRIQGYLGDMARTIMTPANAFRILNQQVVQLQRALGNMIIPLLMRIVPYVTAVVKAVSALAREIAFVLGFELPTIDYSGVEAMRDLGDETDDTTEALKRLKGVTMGFDELNIISDSAAQAVGDLTDELGLNLAKYDYDFLGDVDGKISAIVARLKPVMDKVENFVVSLITWLRENLTLVKDIAIIIGTTMAAWTVSGKVLSFIAAVPVFVAAVKELLSTPAFKRQVGLTLGLTGVTLLTGSAFKITYNGASFKDFGLALLSAAATVGGALLLLGTGPAGWIVGIEAAIIATLSGITLANKKKRQELVKKAIYEGASSFVVDGLRLSLKNPRFSIEGGGITFLDELTSSFGDKLQGIMFQTEGLVEGAEEIRNLERAISLTNQEIEKTKNLWDAGLISGEDYTKKMITLLDQFIRDSASRFKAIQNNIFAALVGPLGAALEAMGVSIPDTMQIVSSVAEYATTQLQEMVDELMALEKLDPNELTDEQKARKEELRSAILYGPGQETLSRLQGQFSLLRFGDPVQAIKEMSQMIADAESDLMNRTKILVESLSVLRDWAPEGEEKSYLADLIPQVGPAARALIGQQLAGLMNEALIKMLEGIGLTGARQAWKAYADEMNVTGDEIQALLAARKELDLFAQDSQSIFTEMKNAAEESGFTLALPPTNEFREYMNVLLERAFDQWDATKRSASAPANVGSTTLTSIEEYQLAPEDLRRFLVAIRTDYYGMEKAAEEAGYALEMPSTEDFGNLMNDQFEATLSRWNQIIRSRPTASLMEVTSEQEYKLSLPEQREYLISIPVDPMFIIGKQLVSGLGEGAESADPGGIGKAIGNSVTEGTEKVLGIESPSKVFMEIGRQLVAGLNRGLSGPSATVGAKGLAESVVKAFTQGVKGTIDATRDMGFDFLHDMSKNTVGDYKPDVKEITSFTEAIKDVIDEASSRVIPEGLARINKILERGVQTPFGKLSTLADKTVTSVYQNFVNTQLKIMETWEGTPALFRDVVFKPILTDSTKALSQSLTEYKKNHNLVKMGWSDLVDWLKENPIKQMGELFGTTIVKISGNFANAFSDMVMNVRWLRDTFVEAKNPIMNMLGDIIKELIRMAAQKAFLWIAGKIFGPGTMLLSTVSGFATGGFPDRGSLFVAREAGPELVGTIGNRSAVVNNDQIVEAVSQGVYEAVVSAMGGQSKSDDRPIEVRVTLDGKEITRTVEKYQSDRGVPIMPRGLMYGY